MHPSIPTVQRAISRAALFLASALAPTLIACSGDGSGSTGPVEPTPAPVAAVILAPTTGTLTVGQTMGLAVTLKDAAGRTLGGRTVAWTSSNDAVATVSATGLVSALADGSTTITATSEGKSAQAGLVVSGVPVAYVQITPETVSLLPNETVQLHAVPRSEGGQPLEGRAVAWQSGNASVVTVDATGLVTAKATGTATISAIAGGRSGFAQVEVRALPPAPVARVALGATSLALEANEERVVTVRLEDASGRPLTDRVVTWTSSNPNVAIVQESGAVVGLTLGDAVITATSEGKSAQLPVNVAAGPSHGLIYDRVSASGVEIFYTDLLSSVALRLNAGNVSSHPSPSPDGSRFVFAVTQRDLTTGEVMHDLFAVDRSGMNVRHLTSMAGVETEPAWSPDGTRIAFAGSATVGSSQDIYVMNADGTNVVNITADMPLSWESSPAWSPDGKYIAFTSLEPLGGSRVWTRRSDGSGDPSRVASGTGTNDSHPTWSPDGTKLAFSRIFAGGETDIMTIHFNGAILTRITVPGDQLDPVWSPDGRFLAYSAIVNGVSQIFTMRVDGSGARARTSLGGRNPAWVIR